MAVGAVAIVEAVRCGMQPVVVLAGVDKAHVVVHAAGAVVGGGQNHDVGAGGIAALHRRVVYVGSIAHIVGKVVHLVAPNNGVIDIAGGGTIDTAMAAGGGIVGHDAVIDVAVIAHIYAGILGSLVVADHGVVDMTA